MRHSLVARLSLLMATIIALSFAAWLAIVHRSTTATFVETRREILAGPTDLDREDAVREALEHAWAAGGLDAVRGVAERPRDAGLDGAVAFVVVGGDLGVVAATPPALADASIRQDEDGTLHLAAGTGPDGAVGLELTVSDAARLRDPAGVVWGRLVLLPGEPDVDPGARFALDVWRSAALWLAILVLLAMAGTALALRRALTPIDRLTRAARQLEAGAMPARLDASGSTEFRELTGAFNAAVDSIARTAAVRERLVADIAHELRTPVTNIRGQLEACEAGLLRPDGEFLATLRGETRLLERLVEDFQQLALSDAGQLRLNLQPLPLRETVSNVLGPLAEAAGAALTLEIPDGLHVRADEERMRQILANLTENAVRHRPDGLSLRVTAAADPDRATLRFEDNGPGVAAVDRPHIFERLYRAERSRNRATGGAGLGLAIVKGLVEAMDGTIAYEDGRDGGAAFAITLPRVAGAGAGLQVRG